MFKRFKVKGDSMLPALKNGQCVLGESLSYLFFDPQVGDIAITQLADGRKIIKRIAAKIGDNYFLKGDNLGEISLDKKFILAKVLL